MDKLSYEEVMHIANLAKINLTDKEVEKYQIELKKLMDDISKIKNIDIEEEEILISPVSHKAELRGDVEGSMLSFKEALENVPNKKGNFVEVPVMLND